MKNTLYKILLFAPLFLVAVKKTNAQTPTLTFQFDGAGNQIERKFVCDGCTPFTPSLASAPTELSDQNTSIQSVNKINALTTRRLIAYPNPLTEILNMTWRAEKGVYVRSLEVASPSGNAIFKQDYPYSDLFTQSVPFQKQVPGMYTIKATYSDGKQEYIKVIKVNR